MAQGYELLTEREKQTLRLLLVGHDAKSMARHFGLSVHTINERLRDARRKLSVSSSKEAARLLREVEGANPHILGDASFGGAGPTPAVHPAPQPDPVPHPLWRARWAIGGLIMISLVAVMLALSSPTPAPLQAADTTAPMPLPETDVSRAARDWLALVDQGKWSESWAAAGHSFRALNPVHGWRWASEKVRVPLGGVVSRTLVSEDYTPAPPHGYRVVRFRTTFAINTAVETLSLDRERTGWKVVGITVR